MKMEKIVKGFHGTPEEVLKQLNEYLEQSGIAPGQISDMELMTDNMSPLPGCILFLFHLPSQPTATARCAANLLQQNSVSDMASLLQTVTNELLEVRVARLVRRGPELVWIAISRK